MSPVQTDTHVSGMDLIQTELEVGIEPTTDGLQNRCSTTELNWRKELVS